MRSPFLPTRRQWLTAVAATPAFAQASSNLPWYRCTLRWGQTNITEKDPERYDIAFWREHWKRTAVQGVIVNAGGIVAYYPSKYPLHHRAQFLGDRDLYGDLVRAARADGLVVLARMDSNRTAEDFFQAHPDWFTRDRQGQPYRAADKYITCINSDYYRVWIPDLMREIAAHARPDGFTDNSWAGLGRESICYCDNCRRLFPKLPEKRDWDNPHYREWIRWNYDRRLEIWDLNNRVVREAGGSDCLWIGMNSGSIGGMASSFRDLARIAVRAEMMLLDHQARNDTWGFRQNADAGKLVHGVLGHDKLVPESMAMYQAGRTSFRVSAKPAAEARMWMVSGFAGGIQPWWHHIGASLEDRRALATAAPVMQWHRANKRYLVNRVPAANVGIVWSQRNTDYHGRDRADEIVDAPYRGFTEALMRARIPYLPVCADHIARDAAGLAVLILPEMAVLSEEQCLAVEQFAARGGGVVASGPVSLADELGATRKEFRLAKLLGIRATSASRLGAEPAASAHTYLRLPERLPRHPVLDGFDDTTLLPYGGAAAALEVEGGMQVLATFVPPFPVYPPETAWMREPSTNLAGVAVRESGAGRVVYFAADIDRRYAREHLPDHARLLANAVRWAMRGAVPLQLSGPGLLDCHLYRQEGRLILHLVNLSNEAAWRAPMDELLPVGPFTVRVRHAGSRSKVRLLVAGGESTGQRRGDWVEFRVESIADHEVAVVE